MKGGGGGVAWKSFVSVIVALTMSGTGRHCMLLLNQFCNQLVCI